MQEQKTIKDFSVVELKAIAFDEIAKLEQAQANIKAINAELALRSQPPVEQKAEVKEEEQINEEK